MRVDAGTSIALSAQAREDFHEQTALEAVIVFLRQYGRPQQMTFDRDPRWVGGVSGRDFPSPLRRLLLCLGIRPHVCPPHRPDKNAFVERFHRTYGQECLQVHHPNTLQEVREVTEVFLQHYNNERPHQGRACNNVPPRVAFPTLPTLPSLPERVDPDAWLASLDQKMYLRHVGRDGCVDVDLTTYYVGPQLAGRTVLVAACGHSNTSLPFGPRIRSSSCFRSKVWLASKWLWTTIYSTSSKRRWQLRDVRRSGDPEKSGSRLSGERELDSSFLPPTFSPACLTFGQVRASSCFSARSGLRITRSHCLSGQLFSLIASSSFSYTSAFLSSISAVSMSLPQTECR